MRYLKMFESVQDEKLVEETWGIDPFELRDIVQMCIEDCGIFCEFEIHLGISSILQFDRWDGSKYDSEQFSSLFKVLPDRIERVNKYRLSRPPSSRGNFPDNFEEVLKEGKYLKICVSVIGIDEDDDERIINLKEAIDERLDAFGAGYDWDDISYFGNDAVEIVLRKEINI